MFDKDLPPKFKEFVRRKLSAFTSDGEPVCKPDAKLDTDKSLPVNEAIAGDEFIKEARAMTAKEIAKTRAVLCDTEK